MLSCKDASRLQSQAQDRPLSVLERVGLQLHLLICENCRRFSRQLALLRQACQRIGESEAMQMGAKELRPEASARILAEIHAAGKGRKD